MIDRKTVVASFRAVAIAILAASCTTDATQLSAGPDPRLPMTVTYGEDPPGVAFTADRVFSRPGARPQTLSRQVVAPLMGWLSPLAVGEPGGSRVIYNAWTDLKELDPQRSMSEQGVQPGEAVGMPELRLWDPDPGRDTPFASGSFSVAWSAGRGIAYAQGVENAYRADRPFFTRVVVRGDVNGRPEVWSSEADRYVVVAWAKDTLLVYRQGDGESVDLLAFDGPGKPRELVAGGRVIAPSPDGELVLVELGTSPTVALVRVADGTVLSMLEVPETQAEWLAYSGSWVGDLVAARGSPGIVLFGVKDQTVAVEDVLTISHQDFPLGVIEPQLLDERGDRIVAVARSDSREYSNALIECRREARSCVLGGARRERSVHTVQNPSRPNPSR